MSETPIISVRGVSKRFGDFVALEDVNIDIAPGEFFALLGPSGCGKTTLLRMISGFESPSEGSVLLDGSDMTDLPPNKRPINMVFQSYAVFPHMTVARNVAYGLKVAGVSAGESRQRVAEALDLVQLGAFADRKPDQLSGGQRQRVALARALVMKPRVLLLDEPLSALDAKLRDAMRLELVNLQKTVGVTFIIVTHDQAEALSMADRIAVLDQGRLRQIATPRDLYERPADAFVADFIGRVNLYEIADMSTDGPGLSVALDNGVRLTLPGLAAPQPGPAALAVRPEKLTLHRSEPDAARASMKGRISQTAYLGDTSLVMVALDQGGEAAVSIHNAGQAGDMSTGDPVWCSWAPADSMILSR